MSLAECLRNFNPSPALPPAPHHAAPPPSPPPSSARPYWPCLSALDPELRLHVLLRLSAGVEANQTRLLGLIEHPLHDTEKVQSLHLPGGRPVLAGRAPVPGVVQVLHGEKDWFDHLAALRDPQVRAVKDGEPRVPHPLPIKAEAPLVRALVQHRLPAHLAEAVGIFQLLHA